MLWQIKKKTPGSQWQKENFEDKLLSNYLKAKIVAQKYGVVNVANSKKYGSQWQKENFEKENGTKIAR
mgnify:CR=1 FL=1